MAKRFVIVLYLAGLAAAGVVDRSGDGEKGKEPEKKPNIVKDYVCLRDGELCHPEFGRNRGLYVSCSNGVAWQLECPRCSYHPINCPTRTLWFDGEKCDWASPKLASAPCIDHFPTHNFSSSASVDKDSVSEQESLLQSLQALPVKDTAEKNKWQSNVMQNSPMYFKSPKSGDLVSEEKEEAEEVEATNALVGEQQKEVKEAVDAEAAPAEEENSASSEEVQAVENNKLRRKSSEEHEPDFPTYLNADDGIIGSKIVRMSDPVYTLVNNPDGSGKQLLMRVSHPFVLEDPARSILPNLNVISSFSDKE